MFALVCQCHLRTHSLLIKTHKFINLINEAQKCSLQQGRRTAQRVPNKAMQFALNDKRRFEVLCKVRSIFSNLTTSEQHENKQTRIYLREKVCDG